MIFEFLKLSKRIARYPIAVCDNGLLESGKTREVFIPHAGEKEPIDCGQQNEHGAFHGLWKFVCPGIRETM